jgi:hypothetical protein
LGIRVGATRRKGDYRKGKRKSYILKVYRGFRFLGNILLLIKIILKLISDWSQFE